MQEFKQIFDKNEQIFWQSGPKFMPFFIAKIFEFLFGLGTAILIFVIFWGFFEIAEFLEVKIGFGLYIIIGFCVLIALRFLIPFLITLLNFKYIRYAITDKRVVLQRGIIGRGFDAIDFDKITNIQVNVGLADIITGGNSGSIMISTAGNFSFDKYKTFTSKPFIISHIPDPYEVFKKLKQISYDIKTDIEYPNQSRPADNPGYHTKYRPK